MHGDVSYPCCQRLMHSSSPFIASAFAEPPIVISMGDPAGIGPEIIVKACAARPELFRDAVVAGDRRIMERALDVCRRHGLPSQNIPLLVPENEAPRQGLAGQPILRVSQVGKPCSDLPAWGQVQSLAGHMAAQAIEHGARGVLQGRYRALVTAPIHKEALAQAGYPWPGHTEMLQALAAEHAGVSVSDMPVRMMLANPDLRTVLNSIHVSLRQAIEAVTASQVEETLRITHDFLARTVARQAHRPPNIAVAGLNPHAGEGGLFGTEEQEAIIPAVARAQALGMHVHGPYPPDTVFMQAHAAAHAPIPFCDVVIAMYHDQGLIPVKYLGVEQGVNVTLGLPLVRTSPDHGTAFDLAGTARADAQSLLAALDMARMLSASDFSPAHGAGS